MSQNVSIAELQRLSEKLQHAYQRRDHYAQLYYRVAAKLEDTEKELLEARKEIQALKSSDLMSLQTRAEHLEVTSITDHQFRDGEHKRMGSPRISPYRTVQIFNMPADCSKTSPKPSVKRVAFSDESKPVAIQRSCSVSEGEQRHGVYSPPLVNTGVQRTQSFSYGKPQLSANQSHPSIPLHSPVPGNAAGLFHDHRLPRVHRGLAYETAVPSAGGYSHHSQRHLPTHINSQHFQSNSLNRSAFGAVPPLSADYRNQPHYSSLPLRNEYTNHMFEGDNWRVKKLNRAGLMALFSEISASDVTIKKIEISSSGLGDLEMMSLLCRELRKKHTIEELSLPNNQISKDSLSMLLDSVSVCRNIKHVKLMNNEITKNCLEILQSFLRNASLLTFDLTGNEIEHHTHLLEHPLPQEQYDINHDRTRPSPPPQGMHSNKSISPVNDVAKVTASLPHNMKLLEI